MSRASQTSALPDSLRSCFWDVDFDGLSWVEDRELIIARVLASGTWDAVSWLRARLGDPGLGEWIVERRGRGLSPQQIRFWELVLDLPSRQVDAWLRERRTDPWDRRQAS